MIGSREAAYLVRRQLYNFAVTPDIKGQPKTGVLGNDLVHCLSKCHFGALLQRQAQNAVTS